MLFINVTPIYKEAIHVKEWFEHMLEDAPMPLMLMLHVRLRDIALLQAGGDFMLLAYEIFHEEGHDDHDNDIDKFACSCNSAVSQILKDAVDQQKKARSAMTKRKQKENKRDEDNR